jgi:hypothetical protein
MVDWGLIRLVLAQVAAVAVLEQQEVRETLQA